MSKWDQKQLSEIAELKMGQSPSSKDCNDKGEGLPFYQGNADFGYIHPIVTKYCTNPKKIADKDDVLISVRAPVGDLNIANEECAIGRGLSAIKPTKIERDFLYYFLQFYKPKWANVQQGSTFEAINKGDLSGLIIPYPPFGEQRKISMILSSVSNAIERTETIIEQTKNVKKGLMQQLLTKGIGHTEHRKTEIGLIPNEWQVLKLKDVSTKITDGAHHTPTYSDIGIPFLRVTDIQKEEIDFSKTKYIPIKEHEELIKRCNPERGDILLSKNGTIGITKVIDWDQTFSIFVSLCLIKLKKDIVLPKYIEYFLQSEVAWKQIRLRSKQGTVTNLHLVEIKELLCGIPTIEEQIKIVEMINPINEKIKKETNKLKVLQNIKKGLLQDLFTGKIGVNVNEDEVVTS
ncbi:restriction endonuclease subunit S [Neobacillus niacini]|uniref:restriction endonuclease subunit S n=1 Tax=Neobacillus niacini TaxID=86668 RepID=UPI001C8DD1C2|nr:restriction endonuclease subunit S [Neobacillus niacini]MBY0144319.1 restriction endonuclease subunit S [Neobacillus niacini]